MTAVNLKRGLGPLLCPNARVLILGSLPGDQSIRQQQYYAHPQNQFWRILAAIYHNLPFENYDAKLAFLHAHRIAVWDVLAAAERPGSLDTAIRNGVSNDIAGLLSRNASIGKIACNGQKAHALFQRHISRAIADGPRPVTIACLPSTSPAAAALPFMKKAEIWRAFLTGDDY